MKEQRTNIYIHQTCTYVNMYMIDVCFSLHSFNTLYFTSLFFILFILDHSFFIHQFGVLLKNVTLKNVTLKNVNLNHPKTEMKICIISFEFLLLVINSCVSLDVRVWKNLTFNVKQVWWCGNNMVSCQHINEVYFHNIASVVQQPLFR